MDEINDEVLQYWVDFNNCNSTPSVLNVPDVNTSDNSTVDHIVYSEGNNCVTTEHFEVFNGDHDWPGAWGNMDINASAEVWKFFSQYSINGLNGCGTTSASAVNNPHIDINIFPNPSGSQLTIETDFTSVKEFKIYSMLGELMITGQLTSGVNTIDISTLSPNIYVFKTENQSIKTHKNRIKVFNNVYNS